MPTVFIPTSLRKYTQGIRKLDVEAKNVREVVEQLEQKFPGIQSRLTENNQLRQGLSVAIDSRICHHGLLEKVSPESEVLFVSTVSGG